MLCTHLGSSHDCSFWWTWNNPGFVGLQFPHHFCCGFWVVVTPKCLLVSQVLLLCTVPDTVICDQVLWFVGWKMALNLPLHRTLFTGQVFSFNVKWMYRFTPRSCGTFWVSGMYQWSTLLFTYEGRVTLHRNDGHQRCWCTIRRGQHGLQGWVWWRNPIWLLDGPVTSCFYLREIIIIPLIPWCFFSFIFNNLKGNFYVFH